VRVSYLRRLDDITPCCWVYRIVVTSQNDVIANSRTNVDDVETISVSPVQLPTATLERRPRLHFYRRSNFWLATSGLQRMSWLTRLRSPFIVGRSSDRSQSCFQFTNAHKYFVFGVARRARCNRTPAPPDPQWSPSTRRRWLMPAVERAAKQRRDVGGRDADHNDSSSSSSSSVGDARLVAQNDVTRRRRATHRGANDARV